MSDEFDRKLQTQISQLQKHKSPERDLWAGIEVAITTRKGRQFPWTAVAASIAACLLGALIVTHLHSDANTATLKVIAQLDAQHQREMSALQVAFGKSQPLTNNWVEQLRDMDKAAEAIKIALKRDPQNFTLLRMLNDVYQRQIDLLKTVHEPNLQHSDLI